MGRCQGAKHTEAVRGGGRGGGFYVRRGPMGTRMVEAHAQDGMVFKTRLMPREWTEVAC